jgi:hypothetical protein
MLQQMHDSNTQVIYLDETVFTFSTFRAKGWAHNRERIRVNDSDLKVTTLAVIAAKQFVKPKAEADSNAAFASA